MDNEFDQSANEIGSDSFYEQIPNPFGRPMKYNPSELWSKAIEYFKWCRENPLYAAMVVNKAIQPVARMRAMTEIGFCLYAGISREVFVRYKSGEIGKKKYGPEYQKIAKLIADCIFRQKFEGASADLLNASIIARDLGLADKKQVEANINLNDKEIEFE